jgi:Uma2 family endonuclease
MNKSTLLEKKPEIIYPDTDGKPMSDNTKQFRYIVIIKENLELLFADNPNVFIAYQQWKEDNIAPQVAFEILSPSNTLKEMAKKLRFYEQYGVEEYYIYDPDKNDLNGYLRQENSLEIIEEIQGFISPLLKVKFEVDLEGLQIYDSQGNHFFTYVELSEKIKETQRQLALEKQRAENPQIRIKLLEEKLKELGIEP